MSYLGKSNNNYKSHRGIKQKFLFLLFFLCVLSNKLNVSQFYANGVTEDQLSSIHTVIKQEIKLGQGWWATITKKIVVTFLNNLINRGIEYFFDFLKQLKSLKENIVNPEDIELSPIGLIQPKAIKQRLNDVKTQTIHAIRNRLTLDNLCLSGPAGTGKTTGAYEIYNYVRLYLENNRIRGIDGLELHVIKGAEWSRLSSEERIKRLTDFTKYWTEQAAKGMIQFIILDEAETMTPDRATSTNDQQLFTTTLLAWMGQHKTNIMVIGTTNIRERLDSAMRRRLGKCIEIVEPDLACRIQIIIGYIEYYVAENSEFVYNVFDIYLCQEFLILLGDYSEKFAGADIDNAVKKAVEEAISCGFLYKHLLLKHINEERYKYATFAKKLTKDRMEEINSILEMEEFWGWLIEFNIYQQLVSVSVDYGETMEDICLMAGYTLMLCVESAIFSLHVMQSILGLTISMFNFINLALINTANNFIYENLSGNFILSNADNIFAAEQATSLFTINLQKEIATKGSKFIHIKKSEDLVCDLQRPKAIK